MNTDSIRLRVLDELRVLSQSADQLDYEAALISHGAGNATSELIAVFCTDLYTPKAPDFVDAFTEAELKSLAHLYGLMVEAARTKHHTVRELLKDPAWRRVISLAKEIHVEISRSAQP